MTADNFRRAARDWLDEGPTRISDRALQEVLDEIHLTPQRRAWWPARRLLRVDLLIRAAAAAGLVVGVAVVGVTLLPSGSGGPPVAPSPPPTATPSPSLEPTGTPRTLAITYGTQYPYRLHLTVPPAWSGRDLDVVIQKYAGAPPNGMAIATWLVSNVYADGCHWRDNLLDPPVGPTVDDLANAIAGLPDREATTPVDVTIDGFPGKELEMTVPDVDFASCDDGEFRSWIAPDDGYRYHQGPGEQVRILILDVDGTRVLTFGRTFPGTSAADRTELNAILDSMRIESLATPSPSP